MLPLRLKAVAEIGPGAASNAGNTQGVSGNVLEPKWETYSLAAYGHLCPRNEWYRQIL